MKHENFQLTEHQLIFEATLNETSNSEYLEEFFTSVVNQSSGKEAELRENGFLILKFSDPSFVGEEFLGDLVRHATKVTHLFQFCQLHGTPDLKKRVENLHLDSKLSVILPQEVLGSVLERNHLADSLLEFTTCATIETLGKISKGEIKAGSPKKAQPKEYEADDQGALIDLKSSQFFGQLLLRFPQDTYARLLETFVGMPVEKENPVYRDGIAEFLNMIGGRLRLYLSNQNLGVESVIPQPIFGNELRELLSAIKDHSVSIPFESNAGPLSIDIAIIKA